MLIRPTEKGREVARAVPVSAMEIFSAALRGLEAEDRGELRRILSTLADRVRDEIAARGDEDGKNA